MTWAKTRPPFSVSPGYTLTADLAPVAATEDGGVLLTVPRGDHRHEHDSGYLPDAHHAEIHAIDGLNHTGDITDAQHGLRGSLLHTDAHAALHSIIGPDHSGFPGGTGTFLRADATFAAPPGGGGAPVITTIEVDIGSIPLRSGRFEIAGAGLTIGKPVEIQQASGPYTGQGTRADEAEMDLVTVTAKVISATVIEAFWTSPTLVVKTLAFDYFVGG